MLAAIRLGYLLIETRHPQRWAAFAEQMLGLPPPITNSDGSQGFQIDAASQRLIVRQGRSDDLAALGWECADAAALDALLARLQRVGHEVAQATADEHAARRVARLYQLRDPDGHLVELFIGMQPAGHAFASAAFPKGFKTGALGMGHAVLVSHDLEAMEAFYAQLFGFGVTERLSTRVGPIDVKGTFMHCNARHHSLALFDLPLRKRMHHFMLQAADLHDIGHAFERAQRLKVPLSLSLGQHPDPDGTLSFYGATPSGFDFEIGAGTQDIDPAQWNAQITNVTSTWGHRPSARLQLKMAVGLLAARATALFRSARGLA